MTVGKLTIIKRLEKPTTAGLTGYAKRNKGQLQTFIRAEIDGQAVEMVVCHPQNTLAMTLSGQGGNVYGEHFSAFRGRRIRLETNEVYDVENPNKISW